MTKYHYRIPARAMDTIGRRLIRDIEIQYVDMTPAQQQIADASENAKLKSIQDHLFGCLEGGLTCQIRHPISDRRSVALPLKPGPPEDAAQSEFPNTDRVSGSMSAGMLQAAAKMAFHSRSWAA
jgi:hypothetical protein